MAKNNNGQEIPDREEILRIIHSAYSLVRGIESRTALEPLSLDHVIQEHLERIQSTSSTNSQVAIRSATSSRPKRPTKQETLLALQQDLSRAVNAIASSKGSK